MVGLARLQAMAPHRPGLVLVVGVEEAVPARAVGGTRRDAGVIVPALIEVIVVPVRQGRPHHMVDGIGDGLEPPFALAQALLRFPALVDVDDRADIAEEFALRAEARGRRIDGPAIGAVGPAQAILDPEGLVRSIGGQEGVRRQPLVVGMRRLGPAEAEGLRLGLPGELVPAPVEVDAGPVGNRDPHHHGGVVRHVAEPRLALRQRFGLRPALGLVPGDPKEAGRAALQVRRQPVEGAGEEHARPVRTLVPALGIGAAGLDGPGDLPGIDPLRPVLLGEDHRTVTAERIGDAPAENLDGARRPARDDALRVHGEDDVVARALHHEAQALLTLAQGLFGRPALADVAVEDREAASRRVDPHLDPDVLLRRGMAVGEFGRGPLRHGTAVERPGRHPLGIRPHVEEVTAEDRLGGAPVEAQALGVDAADTEIAVEQEETLAHPVEDAPHLGLALAQPGLGADPAGRLGAGAEETRDGAVLFPHRRVGEGEMRLLRKAVAFHDEGDIVHLDRESRIGIGDDGREVAPDLRPDLRDGTPHRVRVLVAEQQRIGVVVEDDPRRPPGDEHGLARGDHHRRQRAEGNRPGLEGSEGRRRPIRGLDQRAALAAVHEDTHCHPSFVAMLDAGWPDAGSDRAPAQNRCLCQRPRSIRRSPPEPVPRGPSPGGRSRIVIAAR